MTHHCTCCEQSADCPVPKPPLSCVNAEVLEQPMNTKGHRQAIHALAERGEGTND